MTDLFSTIQLGQTTLANRMVMAPMTRNRCPENVPTDLSADYYRQRASAGLIITEGAQVSEQGIGYPATPGIHTDAQVAGWPQVTVAVHDSDPQSLFNAVATMLSDIGMAYLHVVEVSLLGEPDDAVDMTQIRQHFSGLYIANGGYDKARGDAAIGQGNADLVAFGVPFLANPDLPGRFKQGEALNEADQATFYGGDAHGYTDYPAMTV